MNSNKVKNFITVYQKLNNDNIHLIKDIYHNDVIFIDPLHTAKGVDELEKYFRHLYSNVQSITFNIDEFTETAEKGFLYWTMIYCHPSLNGGKNITVTGHSYLKFEDELVIFHQDYLDTNAMIFEYIPAIGRFIKYLKKRARQ